MIDQPRNVGPWTLSEHLGSGGMGSVWRATDASGRVAAVKLIRNDLRHDAEAKRRFQRELEVASRVTSRRVAVPIGADLDSDPAYIAWEYVDGETLQRRVEREGPLLPVQALEFARQLAEALRDLEAAGITHRDVKPSNILLSGTGTVLVDLGVAFVEDQTGLTSGSQVIGTPGWLTPEQLEGQRPTAASDVFNWAGAVVFAATGRGPFGTDTLPKLMYRVAHEPPDLTGVPDALTRQVRAALSKDPRSRPAARRIAAELDGRAAAPADAEVTRDNGATQHLPGDQDRTHVLADPPRPDATTVFTGNSAPARRRWPAAVVGVVAIVAAAAAAFTRAPDTTPSSAAATEPAGVETETPAAPTSNAPASEPATGGTTADPEDPASYYTDDGSTPALSPTCSGVVGLCLSNPINRAVERLGTEDYRFDLDSSVSYTWDLGAVTVNAEADEVGSIIELSVGTREGAQASTPIDGVVVGKTTLRQFVDSVTDVAFIDEISGEGTSIIIVGVTSGAEGHQTRQVSVSLGWSEQDYHALENAGRLSLANIVKYLGHRTITDFTAGYEFPDNDYDVSPTGFGNGEYGVPPAWAHDDLANVLGGFELVDGSTWDPEGEINVVTGRLAGGATGRGMYAFFFSRDDGYIGRDATEFSQSLGISWRNSDTIAIEYVLYRDGDPGCCPTGGSTIVRFHWDGSKLTALDQMPPTSGPVHR
jgi:predicted Ser/Thr protein kinase